MKTLSNLMKYVLLIVFLAIMNTPQTNAQEKIVFNQTITWEWTLPKWYGGNGFYWWHRTLENTGVTNFGQMSPTNWLSPVNYRSGSFHMRAVVVSQPTNTPFSLQFGIWQDYYKSGGHSETVSSRIRLNGGAGSSTQANIGSPASWWQIRTDAPVDFTRPEDFYRIGIVLWNGTCIPKGQGWGDDGCPETQASFFPLTVKITVVAVPQGQTFSGWNNYPEPGNTKPPMPTYGIDYTNERTNKVILVTDEYSYNSNMSGAVSGTGQALPLTPGQDVYFRTKANGSVPASDIQTLNVPARATAPAFTYDAFNQRTSTTVSNTHEYSGQANMSQAITGSNNYVNFPSGSTYYFRRKATSSAFKSDIQALEGTYITTDVNCSGYVQHYWKLEENNPQVFEDYASSLGALTLVSPARVAGAVDYAQEFNGLSELNIPDDGSFDWSGNSSFSIEFWMNKSSSCPSQNASSNNVIIGRDDAATQLHWWAGVSCTDPGKINFNLIDNNGSGQNLVSKSGVIDGSWHHVAIVRNGTNGTTSIFIDGVRDTSLTHNYTGNFASSVPISIGWLNLGGRYRYNGLLDELAVYNRAISSGEIIAHYNNGSAISYCESALLPQGTLKIMPLGNSITYDNNVNETRPVGERIAYRYHLYNLLNHAGYEFDFVGSEAGGANYFPDIQNAGFPGITSAQLASLLTTGYNSKDGVQETPGPYLDSYLPDIILLHIGTNNVQTTTTYLEDILDEIDAYKARTSKNTQVLLAKIINRQTYNATTTTYNNNIQTLVANRNDPDIHLLDMENGAGIDYATEMNDLYHPNVQGYRKMAVNWFNTLTDVMPDRYFAPEVIIKPDSSGATNSTYTGKIYAIGNPAPAYQLLNTPAGMSVNSATGVVTWTPNAAGDFPVTIVLSNNQGTDTLRYTIHVTSQTTNTVGYNQVFASSSGASNRRAQPVTMTEDGTLSTISVYHNGGSGNVILAVYNNLNGKPGQRIAVTDATPVNSSAGWQTVNLTTPVNVSQGQVIWLTWVFQNTVGVRYASGTPGRAQSSQTWSGGMPETFGTSTVASSIYSIYATYSTSGSTPQPPAAPTSLAAAAVSSSQINLTWTDNATDETGFEIERSVIAGTGFQVIHTTAANANSYSNTGLNPEQTYFYRIRAFNNQGYSAYTAEVQSTTPAAGGTTTGTVGYNQVFASSSGASNRRAQPVTMTEDGTLNSLSVYHNGGSGNVILAVYNTVNGYPGQRIATTDITPVNSSAGWQTVNLSTPVSVSQGQVIWLAWVFQNTVSLRYAAGTPGRANSSQTWSGGMPETFGTSSVASSIYSIYATYSTSGATPQPPAAPTSLAATAVSSSQINLTWTDNATDETGFEIERSVTAGTGFQVIHTTAANTNSYSNTGINPEQTYFYRIRAFNNQGYSDYSAEVQATTPAAGGTTTGTVGYTQVFASSSGANNRRAQPVTMTEDGTLSSLSVYHNGGSGNLILAVYNTVAGYPGQRIATTDITPVNGSAGWQTVNLTTPVSVSQGQIIWLAWVFQNTVGLRYAAGTPGRANSLQTWSGGMPETFGASSVASSIYSIYATYDRPALKSTSDATGLSATEFNPDLTEPAYLMEVYPTMVTSAFTVKVVMPEAGNITLDIFNMTGIKVKSIFNGQLEKGAHYFTVDDLANHSYNAITGVMVVRFIAGNAVINRRIIISAP